MMGRMDACGTLVSESLWLRVLKRPFDLVAALLLVLLLSPVLLLVAVLVKLTSPGPVFFIQDRAGKDGRIFRLVKFRTMRGDRKPDPKELVPLHHPDITGLGYLLRRFKIDEFPQLFNVIRGDMSLVGPRPTLPDQVAAYDAFRRQRLLVRPGITGLAQVYGNSLMPWDERILYDFAYVRRCGFFLDLSILLRTILVVFVGERRMTRPFVETPFAVIVTPPDENRVDKSQI
jgi:undecaprenyl phosphate N,N'-diacetylbacillosamine 1-phosphate transferase